MSSSPSVLVAAAALSTWAHDRRRLWDAEPLARPLPRAVIDVVDVADVTDIADVEPDVVAPIFVAGPDAVVPDTVLTDVVLSETVEIELDAQPSVSAVDVTFRFARGAGAVMMGALERVRPFAGPAADWLMRGAAVVSTMSVVLLVGVNRGEIFDRWDHMTSQVTQVTDHVKAEVKAAANRPVPAAPPAGPARGIGRLTIDSSTGAAQVSIDGKPRGMTPMTVDLRAGAHRVLLKSPRGSVEKSIKVDSEESTAIDEAIFPGWLAVTAPIDLTLSEGPQSFGRDERGWALMAPGPHDIHLDNQALGVHEVRHVLVRPGEPTWLSVVPQASR